MQGNTTDMTPYLGHYISVGFSNDDKMGNDAVLACIGRPSGYVSAHMGYNDATLYQVLPNVSINQFSFIKYFLKYLKQFLKELLINKYV